MQMQNLSVLVSPLPPNHLYSKDHRKLIQIHALRTYEHVRLICCRFLIFPHCASLKKLTHHVKKSSAYSPQPAPAAIVINISDTISAYTLKNTIALIFAVY